MRVLSKEVVVLVFIDTVVAWPLAWYLMSNWLQDFAYRVDLGLSSFVLSSIAALVIALLTIGYRAYRAATANPAKSLRDE